MNILPSLVEEDATTMITLGAALSNGSIVHGHQSPDVHPTKLLTLATQQDGPTYYFRTTYDRVVLLKENDLTPAERPRPQPVMRHPTFQAGENLWRCVFNETLIEGYIYVNKSTTLQTNTTSSNVDASLTATVPNIPYVVKLVEQRVPNGRVPYCEKMTVQSDRTLSSRSEKVSLHLSKSGAEPRNKAGLHGRKSVWRRQQAESTSYCRCQWMVQ